MAQSQTICLCMIVRDEATVIDRCLTSVRGLIDSWVICDTGSVDGTQDLIRGALAGIPGELHERPWVSFAHNRTELMGLAHGKADYLLLLDADMTVTGTVPPWLTANSYSLVQGDEAIAYRNTRLVRGDTRWRYVGATFEYIECVDRRGTPQAIDTLRVVEHGDGTSPTATLERDRQLLQAELASDPDNARATFYLAQTLRDLAGEDKMLLERALSLYVRRATLGGWDEEVYCAWNEAGLLHERLGRWPYALDAFLGAHETKPARLEAVHDLVVGLLERRQFHTAYMFSRIAAPGPVQLPADVLFVQPWIYSWGLAFQHVVAAYWVGDFDGAITVGKRLIDDPAVPAEHRELTRTNVEFALKEKIRLATAPKPPRVWSHAGQPTRGRARG